MSIAHTPNLYSLPPDEQVRVLTQLGLGWTPLPGTDQWWVHPDQLWRVVHAGRKKGRESDLMMFLKAQTDERSRRLIVLGEVPQDRFDKTAFLDELLAWVRERLAKALPIPDSVEWQLKVKP
jgi:hypothetical protein